MSVLKVFVAVAACAAAVSAEGAVFRIDCSAKAGGDGSAARPFSGPEEALVGLRAARASGRVDKEDSVTMLFAPGDYTVRKGMVFTAADGGVSPERPVVWKAVRPGSVRILAAERLAAAEFKPVTDAAVLERLPESARGKALCADVSRFFPSGPIPEERKMFRDTPSPPYVFVNHDFATNARWPNAGWSSFSNVVAHGATERIRDVTECGAFVFSDPRVAKWSIDKGVWLTAYWTHDWDSCAAKVASWGMEGGTSCVMRLATQVPYGIGDKTWGGLPYRRFFAFNLLEELDAPGEWYIDRETKTLYLMPPADGFSQADEVFFAPRAVVPVSTAWRARVSNVVFDGLAFEYGARAAFNVYGDGVSFVGCSFTVFGGDGVGTLLGCSNRVSRCSFDRINGRCIVIGGGDRKTLTRAESVVEDSRFRRFGQYKRTHSEAVEVRGCGITVRRCVFRDAPHTAIILYGNEHLVEYCDIARVLLETSDAGAIYTGRDWSSQGTVIRRNFIHEIGAAGKKNLPAGTIGVYLDDWDCGDRIEENVFWRVHTGIQLGGGRDHPIANNIFAECTRGLSLDCRGWRWAKQWEEAKPGASHDVVGKCRALGYESGVWAERYPHLAGQLADSPRSPLYNPVEHNVFLDCGIPVQLEDKPQFFTNFCHRLYFNDNLALHSSTNLPKVSSFLKNTMRTRSLEDAGGDFGFADPEKGDFRQKPGAWLFREMPAFIPFVVNDCRADESACNSRPKTLNYGHEKKPHEASPHN